MNPLFMILGGWLGFNVLVVVVAWLRQDPGGDKLDVHEILDAARERQR